MWKSSCAWAFFICLFAASGCGPDTIFVRPGLDTPAQHVSNGHQFLKRGKLDDAYREFNRARELDPNYIHAYIGLGVTMGRKGDLQAGMRILDQAQRMTANQQERNAVADGFRQLNEMKSEMKTAPKEE